MQSPTAEGVSLLRAEQDFDQMHAFTLWANSYLVQRGNKIDCLTGPLHLPASAILPPPPPPPPSPPPPPPPLSPLLCSSAAGSMRGQHAAEGTSGSCEACAITHLFWRD